MCSLYSQCLSASSAAWQNSSYTFKVRDRDTLFWEVASELLYLFIFPAFCEQWPVVSVRTCIVLYLLAYIYLSFVKM